MHCLLPRAGLLAAALLFPALAQARELTLPQALSLARERAPAVREAAARIEEAQGRVRTASPLLAHNPTLEAAAGPRTAAGGGSDGVDLELGLFQTVELGGKGGARRDGAQASLAQARAEAQATERAALRDVATAFAQALHAQERLALAHGGREDAAALARAAQRRLELGEVPALDANVARIGLARAHAEVAQAEGAQVAALAQLRQLLGLPPAEPVQVQGALVELGAAALPQAPGTPVPALALLEAQLQEAQAGSRAARAEAIPDVTLGVAYERESEEQILKGALSIPLPLFQRGSGARTTASAQVRRLEGALQAARAAQAIALEAAQLQHQKALEASQVLEAQALPLLEDSLSLAAKSYAAGELGLTELLLVRRDALETRAALLARRLDAALARIHLATLLGVLP